MIARIDKDSLPSHLVVFDGVCVLCSASARWIARHDHVGQFRFATAQSPLGDALFRAHGLRTDEYESNLVLIDGAAYTRLDTIIAVGSTLGWPWRTARVLNLLPRGAKDWLYDRIAKNRYAFFGRKESCDIPSADLRGRLIG